MTEDSAPISVLLVDHEPTDRLLLRRWIERSLEVEIVEASDGLEALELLSAKKIELVVSELDLPQLSGIDLLTLLEADPRRKEIEILIAARNASEDTVRKTIEYGISDYLLKPLQYDWVIQRLRAASERVKERRKHQAETPDDALTRILVADPDPNFSATVEAALFGIYSFKQSHTVAETLVHALRFKPEVVFVSRALPGLRIDFLVDRVRKLPGIGDIRIFELTDTADREFTPGLDGELVRTYVPAKLRSAVMSLLGDEEGDTDQLAWTKPFASELSSAISQTFGMLTGDDVAISAGAEGLPEPEVYGSIGVDEESGAVGLRVDMRCSVRLTARLTGAMLSEEMPDDEPQLDVVNEVLNVVGGRIKHSAEERGVNVKMGLPAASQEPPEPPDAVKQFEKSVVWKDESFLISLSVLRGVPRKQAEEASESEPSAPAENAVKVEPAAEKPAEPVAEAT